MVPTPASLMVLTLAVLGNTVYQECDSRVVEGTTRAWFCQSVGFSSHVRRGPSSSGDSEHPIPERDVSAHIPPASASDRKLTECSPTPPPTASQPHNSTWWDTLDGLWIHSPPETPATTGSTRTWEAEHECGAVTCSHAFPTSCGTFR